jgi:hypothetical protein
MVDSRLDNAFRYIGISAFAAIVLFLIGAVLFLVFRQFDHITLVYLAVLFVMSIPFAFYGGWHIALKTIERTDRVSRGSINTRQQIINSVPAQSQMAQRGSAYSDDFYTTPSNNAYSGHVPMAVDISDDDVSDILGMLGANIGSINPTNGGRR